MVLNGTEADDYERDMKRDAILGVDARIIFVSLAKYFPGPPS